MLFKASKHFYGNPVSPGKIHYHFLMFIECKDSTKGVWPNLLRI